MVKVLKNCVIALAGAGNNFVGPPPPVYVDCIYCGRRDGLSQNVTDEKATELFGREGWTITPTVCPECQGSDNVLVEG